MKRVFIITLTTILFAIIAATTVFAHAKLDKCDPAVGSTVAVAPSQVKCTLTEEVDTKTATMSVFDASGAQVDKKDARLDLNDPDRKTLIVSLDTSKMKSGNYTVKYHFFTPDDSGITDGEFQFVVGGGATPAPTTQVLTVATPAPTEAKPVTLPTTGGDTNMPFGAWVALGGVLVVFGVAMWRFALKTK